MKTVKFKNKKVNEAVDVGGVPQFFDPDKKQKVETGYPELQPLLPATVPPETQKYLEYVTSASYKSVLEKIRRYTGRNPAELQLPQVISSIVQSIGQIQEFEQTHKRELTALAEEVVLSLPEFEMIKEIVKSGHLKLELKLGADTPDLENAITELELQNMPDEQDPEALTPIEIENEEIARNFDEEQNKRRVSRIITQGNAINKFYLFNLVKDKLDNMNPQLFNLYGIATSHIHLLYYAQPDIDMAQIKEQEGAAQGSCNIVPDGDGHKIIAAGSNFPFLIHELVKCIYNYISLDIADNEVLKNETLEQEVIEFLSGPEVYIMFTKYIPTEKQKLLPMIYKEFLKLPISEIKTVLSGKEEARSVMDRVVRRAQLDYNEYKSAIERHENPPYEDAGNEDEPWRPEE